MQCIALDRQLLKQSNKHNTVDGSYCQIQYLAKVSK